MPRSAATIPAQALPPDKRKQAPPAPFENMLPSGLIAKWRMPDPFTIIAFDGVVPDPLTSAVILLLQAERTYVAADDPLRFRHEAANIKGMYALAGAMLVEPKLDAAQEYGDGNGTLGRREMGYHDVLTLYNLFRFNTRLPAPGAPDPGGADASADAASAGDGVQAPAE